MEMSLESLLVAIENGKSAIVLPTHKTKGEREQLIGLNRLFNLYIVRHGHYKIIKQLWEEKYRIIKSVVPHISELGL